MHIHKLATACMIAAFTFSTTLPLPPPAETSSFDGMSFTAPTPQPLSISYTLPESEYTPAVGLPERKIQTLSTPMLSEPSVTPEGEPVEVVEVLPNLDTLTTENIYELTDEEYYRVVSADRSYDVMKTIKTAYDDVGNVYPTGWSMRGECIMSVAAWQEAGGATWGKAGTPTSNYSTATRVPLENLQAGDVIQYIHLTSPDSWGRGVHTVLITGNNWDGTYRIVEANSEGPGLVSKNDSWKPKPPEGWEAAAFRF